MLKLYVSTPKPNADYSQLAAQYGFELIGCNTHTKQEETLVAEKLKAMQECDVAVLNCVFDTCEPYGEVAFEMGYLYGLRKPVIGVLDDVRPCPQKFNGTVVVDEQGKARDEKGMALESDCINLMLYCGSKIVQGDIEEGLKDLVQNGLPQVVEDVDDIGYGLRGNTYAYMAGFEMFYPNGWERGIESENTAKAVGIEGLFPLRPIPSEYGYTEYEPKDDSVYESRKKGFLHDTKVMRSCDYIIANLSSFRDGRQPDSGTAFECGAMYALGKKCYAFYTDEKDVLGPITHYCMKLAQGGVEAACALAAKDL